MNYYLLCFLLSALFTGIHVFRYQNRYGLHFSLMYIFATFSNFGYWQIYDATEVNQAVLANKIAYVGGCFSTLSLMLCIFSVCKVNLDRRVRALFYIFTCFIYGTSITVGYNDMFYKNVSLELVDGRYKMVKEYAFFHTLFYVMLVLYVIICLVVLIIGFRKRKDVSIKSVQLMFVVMIINFTSFFVGRALFEVELICASFVITEVIILVITNRLVLYNVDEMVALSLTRKGEMGAASFDFDYCFFGCNGVARKYYPPLELLAVDKRVDKNNGVLQELVSWLDKLKNNEPLDVIYQLEDRYYKVAGEYLHDRNGIKGYSLVFTDFTEENNRADELVRVATKAKSDVLAQMSHEIRTPINAILGMNEMIIRTTKEADSKQYGEDVKRAATSLLEIINDILDFSKLESGKMEVTEANYNLANLIKDVENMFAARAQNKGLSFITTIDKNLPAGLYGDDVKIRQVLTNLLSNAVKYTISGHVELIVQGDVRDDKVRLYFKVKDTGIGIKPEDRGKLFSEFERIEDKANRGVEGTGLGMSITIRLLQMMDSALQVDSVYGEGSEFYFDLEQRVVDTETIADFRTRQQENLMENTYQQSFVAPKAQILVVDDFPMNRKVFTSLLRETRMTIHEAESGEECLRLVQNNSYDIIFLDHMMPEIDGVETLHRLKQQSVPRISAIPVIALTANVVNGAREFYLKEGFDDFLGKPFKPEELEYMVAKRLPKEYVEYVEEEIPGELSVAEDELPEVSGIHWDSALAHFKNKEVMLDTMRDICGTMEYEAEKLAGFFEELRQSETKGEELFKPYRVQIHSMKSTANLMGALVLGSQGKELEDVAKSCDLQIIESSTEDFIRKWSECRERLAVLLEQGGEKLSLDGELVAEKLAQLKLALEEMDIEQMDLLMEDINKFEFPDDIDKEMKNLKALVTDLDEEKGIPLIEELIYKLKK